MLARLIAYPPDDPAIALWLEAGANVRIGRAHDCGMIIDHPTVSRHHAELGDDGSGWRLVDLGSKNGSFVDGRRVVEASLSRNHWLRFGDVHCELGLFSEADAGRLRHREHERRAMSAALTRRIAAADHGFGPLLQEVLSGVLELTGCSRGFLLVAREDGDFSVHSSRGLDTDARGAGAFAGSTGAVQRAIAQRSAVVVNHVDREPWLAGRSSVVEMQLHSLVCIPLLDDKRLLGVMYADRREPGEPITRLDLDLLHAFCESAAVGLLAGQAIAAIETAPRWNTIVSALREAPA